MTDDQRDIEDDELPEATWKGGATEIVTGDAYSKEHHCGFWASVQ
jgi:hypothetical protein